MSRSLSQIFADAVSAHKSGDFESAERGYRSVLTKSPNEAEAHYLLGSVILQLGRPKDAIDPLRTCLTHKPDHAPALNTLGSILSGIEEHEEAIDALSRAASLVPDDPKIALNFGRASLRGKRYDVGAKALAAFLKMQPHHVQAIKGYATCLAKTDRPDEAIKILLSSITDGIATPGIYETLIKRLLHAKRYDEALKQAEAACGLWPDNNDLLLAFATTLQFHKRNEEAEKAYKTLINRDPDNHHFITKFGSFLFDLGHWKEAEIIIERALELAPNSIAALVNYGRIRQQRGDLDGARAIYERTIQVEPSYPDAYNNMGNVMLYMDRIDDALAFFDKAVEMKPNSNDIRFNRSVARMTNGDISAARQEHKLRFRKESPALFREWDWPAWNGESLVGKRVLLWTEQGVGDEIIHSRCVKSIASQADHCVLECSQRLASLFARSFPDVDVVEAQTPPDAALLNGPFDFHASVLDINCELYDSPAEISPKPYLKADPELTKSLRDKYRARTGGRPLIGISWWSGWTFHAHFKSTHLSQWKNILEIPDVAFVSLQYGEGNNEIASIEKDTDLKILQDPDVDPTGDLDLFAAQVAAMDLVITISNATAHVAGALGVPVWNMTPTGPGRLWYWFLEGQTSPWYDSMRLFRHSYQEGWDGILQEIADLLKETAPELIANPVTPDK